MGTMIPIPEMEGSMMTIMIGSIIGHTIFGMTVAKVVGDSYVADKTYETKTA